jgi:ribosomal protein S27AE
MSEITTCPRCCGSLGAAHVTERRLVCPRCATPLSSKEQRRSCLPDFASKIRRWEHAFWWVMAPLVASGLAVLVLVLIVPVEKLQAPLQFWTGASLTGFGLVVLLPLSSALYRWWHTPSTVSGVPVAFLFLFLALAIVFGSLLVLVATLDWLLRMCGLRP